MTQEQESILKFRKIIKDLGPTPDNKIICRICHKRYGQHFFYLNHKDYEGIFYIACSSNQNFRPDRYKDSSVKKALLMFQMGYEIDEISL